LATGRLSSSSIERARRPGASPGNPIELFGSIVDLDDFASRRGTIGYQVLTSLGPRYRREYLR
jgi:alanine racemase